MACNDSTTNDDATEDEEEITSLDFACSSDVKSTANKTNCQSHLSYISRGCEVESLTSKDESTVQGKLNILTENKRRLLSGGKCTGKSKCVAIAPEFEEKNKEMRQHTLAELGTRSPAKSCDADVDVICEKNGNEKEFADDMLADGFDDQDMERPSFTQPAHHATVPLVLSEPDIRPVIQIPAIINRYLRDYQRDGVRFLFQHFSENTGAILGDDMGLGKTVQVISFVAAVLGKTGTKADIFWEFMDGRRKGKQKEDSCNQKGTFLIVSPGSVMYNWKEELETWGHFKMGLFHGNTKEDTLQRALRGRLDVALTTYETMRNYLNDLNKVKWLAVIMDEVHRLKDCKSQITVAAKALTVKRRYGLTGTPLQNKLGEFWCVLDWANPGCLGKAKRFNREFGKPIREGQTYDATKRELAQGRKKSRELQNKISKFFLRRTKDLIANQLPSKDELVVFCPLTSIQEDVYQTLLQNPDVELIRKKNFPCDCRSGFDRGKCCYMLSSDGEDIKTVTMRFFQLLLKVANHAALLAPTIKQTVDQQKKAKDLCLRVFARYPEFSGSSESSSFELLSNPKYCGKMKVLEKLLEIFHDEHSKVLLFSRSTQLLNILEEFVISKGMVYSRLDGGTRPSERTRLVRDFNLDPSISLCLISTKAGGLGLNFTGANVVIIFDPDWNPSSDLQAQDRAYRIGQRRDVRVYRLISSGTIEEMIYLRQVYKQQLANIAIKGTNERRYFTGVEGDKERKGELFGLENLFSYRAEGASLSKDIVKRTEKLEAGYRVAKYEIVPEKKAEDSAVNEATESADVNQKEDEDPCNLEEIASQLIEDDEMLFSESNNIVHKPGRELTNTASNKKKGEEIDNGEKSSVVDNNATSFSDVEDLLRQKALEIRELRNNSKSTGPELTEPSINFAGANKLVSLEDFFSSEDDVIEPDSVNMGEEKKLCPGTGDPASEIPRRAGIESSSVSCENEEIGCSHPKNYFTKVKEKAGKNERKSREERHDIIPSTSGLNQERRSRMVKSGIVNEFHADDELSLISEETPSEISSSSEDEDSDEGLFTRHRGKRKQKAKIVFAETSRILKEGRSRLRRFPGKHAPNVIEPNQSATGKQSKKPVNTVEQILESCGVHYTHANRHVVGPSEAENHMSKQALQDVFELKQFSQQPANCFPAVETSDESDDLGESSRAIRPQDKKLRDQAAADVTSRANLPSLNRSLKSGSDGSVERIGNSTVFIGSTPRGIRRQHFREMSDQIGFSSEIDLAKAVVESSGFDRREMLKRFYVERNPDLSGLSCFTAPENKTEDTAENERQNLKRAKRSFEKPRTVQSRNEVLKKSERKSKKRRTNRKVHWKDSIHEASYDSQEVQGPEAEVYDSLGRQLQGSSAGFQDKREKGLTKSARGVDTKDARKVIETDEVAVDHLSARNCRIKDNGCRLRQRGHLQQEEDKSDLTFSTSNGGWVSECPSSTLANTCSIFSESILDEFLSTPAYGGGGTSENEPNRTAGRKEYCGGNQKEDKLMNDAGRKGTINKVKSTSVLDDFI